MHNRIKSSKQRLSSAAVSQGSVLQPVKIIFQSGFDLLNAVENDAALDEAQKQEKHDIVIVGTVLCALMYNISLGAMPFDLKEVYPFTWQDLVGSKWVGERIVTNPKRLNELILRTGYSALLDINIPFNINIFEKNGVWESILTDNISVAQFDAYSASKHFSLYQHAYKEQSRLHQRDRWLGVTLAVLATFFPPLSLMITVPNLLLMHPSKSSQVSYDWKVIGKFLLAAIVPGYSTYIVLSELVALEKNRHENDFIKRTMIEKNINSQHENSVTYSQKTIDNYLENLNAVRQKTKQTVAGIDWVQIKEQRPLNKPKKIAIADRGSLFLYRDRAQYQRNEWLLSKSSDLLTERYKASQQESGDIVKELESRAWRR